MQSISCEKMPFCHIYCIFFSDFYLFVSLIFLHYHDLLFCHYLTLWLDCSNNVAYRSCDSKRRYDYLRSRPLGRICFFPILHTIQEQNAIGSSTSSRFPWNNAIGISIKDASGITISFFFGLYGDKI